MADGNLSGCKYSKRSGSGLRRQNFPSTNALSPPDIDPSLAALTVPAIYIDRHSGSRGETTANGDSFSVSAVSALC